MRTIKFRGKDIETGEWLYGNIQVPTPPFDKYFMWDCDHNQKEVIPDTVGQFTGLKDKNGREIYEGDIMATDNDKKPMYLEICYIVEESSYFAKYRDSGIRMWKKWIDDFQKVVVGNIHDNPELINGKEKQL